MKVARIVAALHPGHRPGRTLEAAARRAHALDAELLGLFIEDVELLHFAAMPFACEIGTASGRRRAVDPAAMARYMTESAVEMRAALNAVAARSRVHSSFRITRGTVLEQLLAAGSEQQGRALLLPPGVDVDEAPRILTRAQLAQAARSRAREAHPILLLAADETGEISE